MILGKERIPKKGPLVLAVTHPNAFLDDVLVGIMMNRDVFFLARGDVFKKPVARFFLKAMHVYPIIRPRDSRKEVRKNLDLIENYKKMLVQGKVILIHPEGLCVNEKNVRPLKKGMAKMALGAENDHDWDLGLKILPIGLNYYNAPYSREDITIHIGTPIAASKYALAFKDNEAKAYRQLTEEVDGQLNDLSIKQDKGTECVSDFALRLEVLDSFSKNKLSKVEMNELFLNQKHISDKLNTGLQHGGFNELNAKYQKLQTVLISEELKIDHLYPLTIKPLTKYFWAACYFLGTVLFFYPQKWISQVCEKLINSIEFRASILLGLLFVLGMISCVFWTTLLTLIFGIKGFLTIPIVLIVAVGFAKYWDIQYFARGRKKFQLMSKAKSKKAKELIDLRNDFQTELKSL
jgi:1-acyl-sn-glycerol-3-phosphate acyltransferase